MQRKREQDIYLSVGKNKFMNIKMGDMIEDKMNVLKP